MPSESRTIVVTHQDVKRYGSVEAALAAKKSAAAQSGEGETAGGSPRARGEKLKRLRLLFERTDAAMNIKPENEAELQAACIGWCRWKGAPYSLVYSNALESDGSRSYSLRLKYMGRLAGTPDLVLPVPSGPYGALYVELKYGSNDLTGLQTERLKLLMGAGNAVAVAWDLPAFISVATEYLEDPWSFEPGV